MRRVVRFFSFAAAAAASVSLFNMMLPDDAPRLANFLIGVVAACIAFPFADHVTGRDES